MMSWLIMIKARVQRRSFIQKLALRPSQREIVAQIAFLIPFLVAIPMALLFGFSLSSPDSIFNIIIMGLCLGALCMPLLIRWHDFLLIAAWNAPVSIFLFPGEPQVWMLLAVCSLVIGSISNALSRNLNPDLEEAKDASAREVSWAVLLIFAVVFFTAMYRGGIGSRALGGGTYGARKYVPIFFSCIGYFALTKAAIKPEHRWRAVALFFGGIILLCMSNLVYMAGPSFYWLYYFFPVEYAVSQAVADLESSSFARFTGIAFAMSGVFYLMMARYGIKGILDFRRPWRLLIFLAAIAASTLGGFRSLLVLLFLVFLVQFYYEGLFRTALFPLLSVLAGLLLIGSIGFIHKMPLVIQRTLSFLPIHVDPAAREIAEASTEWRFRMWSVLWDEVPNYLAVGKGYVIDPAELAMIEWMKTNNSGFLQDFEEQMTVGNYHSGPFSVLLSFGIPGVIVVLTFWFFSVRLLRRNLTRGSPEMRSINTLLLSTFIAKIILFLAIFGDFSTDLAWFCGLVGLSVALNKPVSKNVLGKTAHSHELTFTQPLLGKS